MVVILALSLLFVGGFAAGWILGPRLSIDLNILEEHADADLKAAIAKVRAAIRAL